jgi:8-oxo-dGTP pyrophosphatase MutT (NUDIX family)
MLRPARRRHLVATGYIVRDGKTLLLWHKKLGMWLPPGGHLDTDELPHEALLREIKEETGYEAAILAPRRLRSKSPGVSFLPAPFHIQLEEIPSHPQHLDLIYVCRPINGRLKISPREHGDRRWHDLEDLKGSHVRQEVRVTASLAIRLAKSWAPL